MAENLLALSAPKPMTATELGNFLSKNIYPLTSIHAKGEKNYLDGMISKLEAMKEESLISESRAYNALGVKSLEELQSELDKINAAGLFALTNRALRKMPAIKKTRGQYVKIQDIRDTIEERFTEFVQGRGYKSIMELGYEEARGQAGKLLEEMFHEFEKQHLGVERGTLLSGFRYGQGTKKGKKVLGLLFKDIKKDRKKQLSSILGLKSMESEETKDGTTYTLTMTINDEEEMVLDYYPYFALTAEEKRLALENEKLWDDFVEAVSSCTNHLKDETAWVMKNLMGKEEFIGTGGSYADIVGILGELQTLVFLHSLGAPMNNIPRFLGHAVNNKSQKVGVDVALGGIGFQVKNYSMYGSREDQNQGIQLSGDYTLKNFLDLIEPNFSTPGMRWNLEQFYAASAYHIAIHSDFNNIRHWMDNMQRVYLPRMYHGAIAELLPLKQITWIDKETRSLGKTTNAFYVIGGERILPVSKILTLYIKYLNDFKKNIDNPKLITMRGDNGGVKYTKGETYSDYFENREGYYFSGYSAIADNIYVRYNINMNIDYSIEEVLSKALKN